MTLAPDEVGHDAGWHLAFFSDASSDGRLPELSIGAGDYYAEINATLPTGLDGGTYAFVIEGITNAHYKKLHAIWTAKTKPLFVDLYLYWRDTGGVLGYLASVAGLTDTADSLSGKPADDKRVARLIVTKLSRRVGARRYEAIIEARERVYERLQQRLVKPPKPSSDAIEMAAAVADQLKVSFKKHAPRSQVKSADKAPEFAPIAGKKGTTVLAALETHMEAQANQRGLPMYVIRDGKLHIGSGRPIPLEGNAKKLDAAHGLVHIETAAKAVADEPADLDSPIPSPPPTHLQYALTLKGRPDLRPGDQVTFADPFSDGQGTLIDPSSARNATTTPSSFTDAVKDVGSSLFGGASELIGGAATMYVTGVSHRLSRTEGFVTTVAGIGVQSGKEWDLAKKGEKDSKAPPPPAATTQDDFAAAIEYMVRSLQSDVITVGEVRAFNPSGSSEPPGQTVDVWVGLAAGDGKPAGVRRLAIDRQRKSRVNGVPMVTPFAWGRAGLVVPRYPGTRVLLAHARGSEDEPVDVGALWESGHGPESEAGDWWLILPANVDSKVRQSVSDQETPQEPSGAATNDLIDADGNRVIECGRLTVRVSPNNLQAPGARPGLGDDANRVTIEHESGSKITIDNDGNIVIDSAKDLTLKTANTMTLEADDVKVRVKNSMDVEDR